MLIRLGYELIFEAPGPDADVVAAVHAPFARRQPAAARPPARRAGGPPRRLPGRLRQPLHPHRRPGRPRALLERHAGRRHRPTRPGHPEAVQHAVEDLPADVLPFLLASRYCEVDRLSDIAWNLFGNAPPGWGRVQAVCDWVHANVRFGYAFARPTKTAYDVYTERAGVCRDFTHLAITFCRCLNIPARYATGYLGDIGVPVSRAPMDFSAWFEVYLGGQLAHLRRPAQRPAHRPRPHGPRPRRRGRRPDHLVRPDDSTSSRSGPMRSLATTVDGGPLLDRMRLAGPSAGASPSPSRRRASCSYPFSAYNGSRRTAAR